MDGLYYRLVTLASGCIVYTFGQHYVLISSIVYCQVGWANSRYMHILYTWLKFGCQEWYIAVAYCDFLQPILYIVLCAQLLVRGALWVGCITSWTALPMLVWMALYWQVAQFSGLHCLYTYRWGSMAYWLVVFPNYRPHTILAGNMVQWTSFFLF